MGRKYRARKGHPGAKTGKALKPDQVEIARLEKQCATYEPPTLADGQTLQFSDMPLSRRTLGALKVAKYTEATEIQQKAIPLALKRRDILGAAKTGSGKTLGFLVPTLEMLYRARWTRVDGLGALIISPTRELAIQIFDVLRRIGGHHEFSAGLIIGGKEFEEEKQALYAMNILICTPGRLLQHMDQSPEFEYGNLKVLVLDEADRILDMGFKNTVNAILQNLPKDRLTWLFSATQTKSVGDLARLSLQDPEYVAVHEDAEFSTPAQLTQTYLVCELPQKLDVLFSFLKLHLKAKMLVFMASCKQVRFVYEIFCQLQPGTQLLHIHGRQKQSRRLDVFDKFKSTKNAVLFATDLAARGLDFPAVDWVVQMDCPDDTDTYIHRVGRTARYGSKGQALLFLLPSEQPAMLEHLHTKKIPITEYRIKEQRIRSIQKDIQYLCFKNAEMKYLAKKCFISYMRSVYLQKDKNVFNVHALPAEEFADTLGLPGAPIITFVEKSNAKNQRRTSTNPMVAADSSSDEPDTPQASSKDKTRGTTRIDKIFGRQNQDVLSSHYQKLVNKPKEHSLLGDIPHNDGSDLFVLRRADHTLESAIMLPDKGYQPISKQKNERLKKQRIKSELNQKWLFDDEGELQHAYDLKSESDFRRDGSVDQQISTYINQQRDSLARKDQQDREVARDKRREKTIKKKYGKQETRDDDEIVVTLADGAAGDDFQGDSDGDRGDSTENNAHDRTGPHIKGAGMNRDTRNDMPASKTAKKRARPSDKGQQDDSDDEPLSLAPGSHRPRQKPRDKKARVIHMAEPKTLAEEEDLALQLLQGI
ncbi:ATP-dependent RNA helicase dbp4 [Dimargaris verticillata]|uniref:ATP-dependent RNA helicase n=1 Tax=Dimargaris verticillata TaxID=2761393 RepID=A0A9W8B2R4_9FUNG|nr:ATP-dependent RNA helicase dbp4 [Dimargaris verticillata]